MNLNPAYFINKVAEALTRRGMDSKIEDADAGRIVLGDKTYEPRDDESPERMAGRIWLDRVSGAERLRAIVAWIDYHNENFNDHYTAGELTRLWEYGQLNGDRVPEFADTWTQEQIVAAIGVRVEASGMSDVLLSMAALLDAEPRTVALTWDDEPGLEKDGSERIVDVIIGGRFRPTRATWQRLIDAGLPMCSWEEASESLDLEADGQETVRRSLDAEAVASFDADPSAPH